MNVHQVISGVLGIWTFLSPQILVMRENNAINHPSLGMVTIAPIKMVMTGGWFMTLLYLHHIITCFCMIFIETPRSPMCPMPSNLLQGKSDTQDIRSSQNRGPSFSRSGPRSHGNHAAPVDPRHCILRNNGVNLPAPTIFSHELLMFRWI